MMSTHTSHQEDAVRYVVNYLGLIIVTVHHLNERTIISVQEYHIDT